MFDPAPMHTMEAVDVAVVDVEVDVDVDVDVEWHYCHYPYRSLP